ncbi:protein of unknown function [bacterium A37T11]|nr:protein of unknown function [bacterium A37T11]
MLKAQFNGATFGDNKGDYPYSSKVPLENQISYLTQTLSNLKDGYLKLLDSDMDRIILESNRINSDFSATIRLTDFVSTPAELLVNGMSGGYIDFGIHSEYSAFGELGKQSFTIDFWLKIPDISRLTSKFSSILSTFTDDDTNNHERKGWFINSFFGRLRMSYALSFSDLLEPGAPFSPAPSEWTHIAVVTNENGVDGEKMDGIPVMTKIYVNGNLILSQKGSNDKLPYTSNNKPLPMVAFTQMNARGEKVGDKGINGRMKYLHIWKSAKTQEEIRHLINNPGSVTGTEADLVCGWSFDKTVSDNQHIIDQTRKFEAKLIGSTQWIE